MRSDERAENWRERKRRHRVARSVASGGMRGEEIEMMVRRRDAERRAVMMRYKAGSWEGRAHLKCSRTTRMTVSTWMRTWSVNAHMSEIQGILGRSEKW